MATKPRDKKLKEEVVVVPILDRLIEEQQQRGTEEDAASDITILFCGVKKSGKTSLIDRFINPAKDEKDQPKATVALDYKFARYAAENSPTKVTAHIYELGGGDNNEDVIAIPVSPGTVGNLVLAVTLDLSEPHFVLPSLEKWLTLLRAQVQNSLNAIAKETTGGEKRVDALQKARKEPFENHADKDHMNIFPVQLAIFCCKFDTFVADTDPEKRKHLCRALRYIAHVNGASLIFSSLKDKGSMNAVRGLLRQLLFGAPAKPKDLQDQVEPSKPICVVAGKDTLQGIGTPSGTSNTEQGWHNFISSIFPEAQTMQKAQKKTDGELVGEELLKYAETSVDGMVEQRIEELQQYRRQVERNQRLASEGVDGAKLGTYNA